MLINLSQREAAQASTGLDPRVHLAQTPLLSDEPLQVEGVETARQIHQASASCFTWL